MRSAFSLQVSATVVLCHVKLMSGVLSLEVREQMLCSGLCNSAATSIVYLFTSFLGSDVNVEDPSLDCRYHFICLLRLFDPVGTSEKCSETGVIHAIMISNLFLWNHSLRSLVVFWMP